MSPEMRAHLTERYENDMKTIFGKWPGIRLDVAPPHGVDEASSVTKERAPEPA
jgi:hypothetical protein